jgi:eukaryotic-like serine/threonine-protein kinase
MIMADPTEIGKYKIQKKIGEGGMGKVYKAAHPTLNRNIIIKQLTVSRNKVAIQRFLREASLMLDFRHENIVPVYDHFKERSSYYIVMEFVDGMSLEDLIKRSPLPPIEAILIFREICRGLKYAHDHGVIHRDIKPDNVLISNTGEVKLADFGIASSDESEDNLTKTGTAMGTPAYMSPEQIEDAKNADCQSDIYSMGVMLYQMVTGKRPFPGNLSGETLNKIHKGIYVKPSKIRPETPPVLRKLIRKMMHHKKSARFKDLQQVLDILSKYTRQYTDQFAINKTIQKYLEGEEPLGGKRFFFTAGLLLKKVGIGCVAAALAGFLLFRTGVFHELFLSKSHGIVEVKVELPPDYYKDAKDVYAIVEFLPEIPKVGDTTETDSEKLNQTYSYLLHPSSGLKGEKTEETSDHDASQNSDTLVLTTDKQYLPAGNYSVRAKIETASFFQSLSLLPRNMQRQNMKTQEGREILLPFAPSSDKNISVLHRIFDRDTGESISRDTVVLMKDGDKWIDWDVYKKKYPEYLENLLKSGREYDFKYSYPGYFDQEVVTEIQGDSDSLILNVKLVKKTGRLVISSDSDGLQILIDNKEVDYLGGKVRTYVEFGETLAGGAREFELLPGNYILTIRKDSRHMKNHEIVIKPEGTLSLEAVYDSGTKEVVIQQSQEDRS